MKPNESLFREIIITLAAVSAATVLALFLPFLRGEGMYFLYLTAIVCSSLYGSFRAGIAATCLSLAISFLISAQFGQSANRLMEWLVLVAFALASCLTVFLCYAQKNSERARRTAESKYRMIFEDAITGIYETTLDGRYAAANPKLAEMFAYESADELIQTAENLNRRFYVQPGRRAEFARLVEEKGNLVGFESEIFRRDGTTIWISENAVAVRDSQGKLTGFQGTTIDITSRKMAEAALQKARVELEQKVVERTAELERANQILRDEIDERMHVEKELRRSEEKFRSLVEVSSEMIWEVDEKSNYTYVSPKSREFNGYAPEEILGNKPFMLMPPEEAKRVAEILRDIGKNRETFYFLETITVKKDGTVTISETSGVPFFDDAGNFCGYRGVARDITTRKKAENDLIESQKRLRELSAHLQLLREEERKSLARELHDELGQQLTALKIELVRLDGKLPKSAKKYGAEAIAAMLEVVDMAMETTRKIVAELRPGVLDELGLAAAMEWQIGEFQKRTGIVCKLEIEFDEAAACQNLKTTVFRILQECLTNIARHSGAAKAEIVLKDEGWRIFFEIEDDGRGFAAKTNGNAASFGLLGIRERAFILNGSVETGAARLGGARVTVSIPRPTG